jgi:hypothetical protein
MDPTCPANVLDGRLYTKEKRQELYGRVAGGDGSKKPELFQRAAIVEGTGRPCPKTKMRINKRQNTMCDIACPMKKEDGFDYTEDFDGKQEFNQTTVWINLKSVVGTGGAQTRALRECYHHVEAQLNYLLKSKKQDYFANVFDGDEAARQMRLFRYLLDLPEFDKVEDRVYVGDLKGYFAWLRQVQQTQAQAAQ